MFTCASGVRPGHAQCCTSGKYLCWTVASCNLNSNFFLVLHLKVFQCLDKYSDKTYHVNQHGCYFLCYSWMRTVVFINIGMLIKWLLLSKAFLFDYQPVNSASLELWIIMIQNCHFFSISCLMAVRLIYAHACRRYGVKLTSGWNKVLEPFSKGILNSIYLGMWPFFTY